MFESIPTDDAAARFRAAAFPPFAAVILALAYFTLVPVLGRTTVWMFRSVLVLLLAGAILGAIAIVRALLRERPRGLAIGWLVVAIVIEYVCVRFFLSLAFP